MGSNSLQGTGADDSAATGDGEAGVKVVGHSMKAANGLPGTETPSLAIPDGESVGVGGAEPEDWPRTEATNDSRPRGTGAVVPQLEPTSTTEGVLSPREALGLTESDQKRLHSGVFSAQRLPSFSEEGCANSYVLSSPSEPFSLGTSLPLSSCKASWSRWTTSFSFLFPPFCCPPFPPLFLPFQLFPPPFVAAEVLGLPPSSTLESLPSSFSPSSPTSLSSPFFQNVRGR